MANTPLQEASMKSNGGIAKQLHFSKKCTGFPKQGAENEVHS